MDMGVVNMMNANMRMESMNEHFICVLLLGDAGAWEETGHSKMAQAFLLFAVLLG